MRQSTLELLVDPVERASLTLHKAVLGAHEQIETGELHAADGQVFPIVGGIPRFSEDVKGGTEQVSASFGYKWHQRHTFDTDQFMDLFRAWAMERYGFETEDALRSYFSGRKRVLDAGCGAGMGSQISASGTGPDREWVGVDLSSAIDVARARLGHLPNTEFLQADLNLLPFRAESFDTIYSEGVLHHTPSTEMALKTLVPFLKPGGEFLFYVYRKKGPIREFTDDHVRNVIAGSSPEKAWELLRPLTQLAKVLSDLHAEVEVPEDIPLLGIKAGRHDVQRLIYWNFAKLYWNDSLSFEENNHVNFDWYHPRFAFRQTEEEVRRWCAEAGLQIVRFHEQESGWTVRAVKTVQSARAAA